MTDMPKEIYVQRAKCTVTNELSYSCDPEQILIDDTKYVRKDKTITVELLEGMKCTDKPSDDLDDGRFFEEVRIQEGRNEVLNELINKLKRSGEAFERIISNAVYGIPADDHEIMNKVNYDLEIGYHDSDVETIRQALQSTTSGDPIEKTGVTTLSPPRS